MGKGKEGDGRGEGKGKGGKGRAGRQGERKERRGREGGREGENFTLPPYALASAPTLPPQSQKTGAAHGLYRSTCVSRHLQQACSQPISLGDLDRGAEMRSAEGTENKTPKASKGQRMVRGHPPPQPTMRLGERP